jgi:haloalkane dehalogenase
MHYVDEGVHTSWPVLMLHGEPTWSYLYRKMIPIFTEAGYRAIAPDFIGFGRSDKPQVRKAYTYQKHVNWMKEFIIRMELTDITLVCQDWGGLIGLRLVADMPERFARVVAANTGLPTGAEKPSEAFLAWRELSQKAPELTISRVVQSGTTTTLKKAVCRGYDAPFPDETYKAGARQFPKLVPTSPDDAGAGSNRKAWKALSQLQIPFLTAFSDSDPVTRDWRAPLVETIPGAKNANHVTIRGAGHFLQEDRGSELAFAVLDFCEENPVPAPDPASADDSG